jgi:hypothetical protein
VVPFPLEDQACHARCRCCSDLRRWTSRKR